MRIFIKDIYCNGDKIEVNILNSKLEESTKKLFSESIEESNFKNYTGVAIRTGEQLHQYSDDELLTQDMNALKIAEHSKMIDSEVVLTLTKIDIT